MSLIALLISASFAKDVQLVYLQEADQPLSPTAMADLELQALELQAFYLQELGVTFELADPPVVHLVGQHDTDWYVNTPDGIHGDPRWYRLGNLRNEVYGALGLVDFDPERRVVVYPAGQVDGRVGANFGGAFMDGDDLRCIADRGPTVPYDVQYPAGCLDHVVHELGHVFGLGHTGPNDDCMRQGFYYHAGGEKTCFFDDTNRQTILDDPDNVGWLTLGNGVSCGDQLADCPVRAAAGECASDPALMLDECQAACDVCRGDLCYDEHPTCATWASVGECAANPGYMLVNCQVSCGVCSTPCADGDGDRVCDAYDQCWGSDPWGDVNTNGVCDPTFSAGSVQRGATATFRLGQVAPGADAWLLLSALGDAGPERCVGPATLCTTLVRPRVLARGVADPTGEVVWSVPVPAGAAPGTTLWFQAAWADGAVGDTSGVVEVVVQP